MFITIDHNFWRSETPAGHPKYQKTRIVSNSLGQGPGEVSQGGLKALHLWHHSQKIHNPQPEIFFQVQTRRLSAPFEPFNSSLLLSAPELRERKATCNPVVLAQKSPKLVGCQSVKWLTQTLKGFNLETIHGLAYTVLYSCVAHKLVQYNYIITTHGFMFQLYKAGVPNLFTRFLHPYKTLFWPHTPYNL